MAEDKYSRKGIKLRQWSQEDMNLALRACREDNMGLRAASRLYNVPRKTLGDRINRKVSSDNPKLGRQEYLSEDQERDLCKYIEYMAGRAFPLTVQQIKMFAWCIDKKGENKFTANGPSKNWWNGFKRRHSESIRLRRADSLDRGRALFSTTNMLRHYFQLLKEQLVSGRFSDRPQDVYNCDETIIELNKSTQKVVVPKRFKSAHSRHAGSSEHISIHCCVNAAGAATPPFIIFKGSFPGGNYTKGGPDNALYGKQESGFMDSTLFLKWFTQIFLPYARPTPERSVLLLLDGHISHCSIDLINSARENNVILLALAPHTTHICQVLDVAVYKSFKSNLSKLLNLGKVIQGNFWVAKRDVPRIVKKPLEEAMSMSNIKAGFRKCGIMPFNPNAIDKDQLLRNKLIPDIDVDLSFPPDNQPLMSLEEVPESIEVININDDSDFNIIPIEENLFPEEPDIDSPEPIPSTLRIRSPLRESTPFTLDRTFDSISIINNSPKPTSSNLKQVDPIVIKISTKSNQENIPIHINSIDINSKKIPNPLVDCGIISQETAEILLAPPEEVPTGRKRPLRIKSQARVMTANEVYEDLQKQKEELELKRKKQEELANRRKSITLKNKSTKNIHVTETSNSNASQVSLENSLPTRTRPHRILKPSQRLLQSSLNIGQSEDECFSCNFFWDEEPKNLQLKWAGCDNCFHWICPRCLPINFDYNAYFLCDDCRV